MQSAKRHRQTLSALSIAAAAAFAARSANAVTLTLYYGQETNYANSNNGVFVGSGFDPTAAHTDTQGEGQGLTGTVSPVSPSGEILMNSGQYLSLAIDAVLTGNANPYAGLTTKGFTQPSFLGPSEVGISVSSSDAHGLLLDPVSSTPGNDPFTSIDNFPAYVSSANINQSLPANGGSAIAPVPSWTGISGAGDIQPNLPGYDTAPNSSGGVGYFNGGPAAFPGGGNLPVTGNSAAGIAQLTQFTTQSNVASYSNATDVIDNIVFQAVGRGKIVLTPFAVSTATLYWSPASGQGTGPILYSTNKFHPSDVIVPLPSITIQIGEPYPPSIINITAGPEAPNTGFGNLITNGTGTDQGKFSPVADELSVSGSNGKYSLAQVTGINGGAGASADTIEAATFSPANETEIFALDVLVNGTQASASELQTLLTSINQGDSAVGPSDVTASTEGPFPDLAPSNYNLYLYTSGYTDAMIGINMSQDADPNLVGYTFSAVAAVPVPEPTSAGVLAAAAFGLTMRRRPRFTRSAANSSRAPAAASPTPSTPG